MTPGHFPALPKAADAVTAGDCAAPGLSGQSYHDAAVFAAARCQAQPLHQDWPMNPHRRAGKEQSAVLPAQPAARPTASTERPAETETAVPAAAAA